MIFYLYENEPLASGILDMEELSKSQMHDSEIPHKRSFAAGPF